MYVWIDALTNYLTSIGYPNEEDMIYLKIIGLLLHIVGKGYS